MAKVTKKAVLESIVKLSAIAETNKEIAAKIGQVEKGSEQYKAFKNATTKARYVTKLAKAIDDHADLLAKAGLTAADFANAPRNCAEKKIPYLLGSVANGAPLAPEKQNGDYGYMNTLGLLLNNAKYRKGDEFHINCRALKKELQQQTMTQPSEVLKLCLMFTTGYNGSLKTDADYKIPVDGLLKDFAAIYAN